jgi:hypothetical protein
MNNNNNNTIFDDIEDLDSTWIQEFENLDNDYKNYYTEDLSFLRIHSIYVNTLNDIEKVREEKILLKEPGIINREELLSIIKHNSFSNDTKYSLLSILKFNINVEPEFLKTFLKSKDKNIGTSFLQSVKNIDTLRFEKSIAMFHDINDLIIIFHQRVNKNNATNGSSDSNNRTKKVFINSNTKKRTKRKELKEITT